MRQSVPGSLPVPSHAWNIASAEWSIGDFGTETYRLQLQRIALGVFPARDRIGAGIALEEIVEAAIFLDDENDVRDFTRTGLD